MREAVAWASQWVGKLLARTPPEISRIPLLSLLHSQQASGFCYICSWAGLVRTDSMSARVEYELKDHLGNVRAIVTDQKEASLPTYYDAVAAGTYHYYPFGMLIPGTGSPVGQNAYRYGFNGKEKDADMKGNDATYDYGFRIYDARLARFLSVDPLTKKYPELTIYKFASNNPIQNIDIDGLEGFWPHAGDEMLNLSIMKNKGLMTDQEVDGIVKRNATLAIGGAQNLVLTVAIIYDPALALKLGSVGSIIGGLYSTYKGGDKYDIVKSAVSGFYSGATLALGPESIGSIPDLLGVAAVGSLSGIVSSSTDQAFDNMFGGENGSSDYKQILKSGGFGALANLLSVGIIQIANAKIDAVVKKSTANTATESYREMIKNAIKAESPTISSDSLKKAVRARISNNRRLIIQQGEQAKKAVKESVEKGINILQESRGQENERENSN